MAGPEFLTDFDPRYRRCVEVAPGIRRVVAENPSKYTAWGTGTYLIGRGRVAVVDPGPDREDHVAAVLGAVSGETVTHLLVTHTHADHSPAAAALAGATGAVTVGFGPHPPGADDGSEEHGDTTFTPDVVVRDGDRLELADLEVECLHTPGHISNHVCYAVPALRAFFPGDHVMGWSTTVISPPAGDLRDYLANLRRLLDRDDGTYYPTHGPPVTEPHPYVAALVRHREERTAQVLAELADGPRTVEEVVAVVYAAVREELHAPAARSTHAHLVALAAEGRVAAAGDDRTVVAPLDGGPGSGARWHRT